MDSSIDSITERRNLLRKHVTDLHSMFPCLELIETPAHEFLVVGNVGFTVHLNGTLIRDDYDIEITIPRDYPESPPTVREVGNKIPKGKGYHVNPDGTMCLGAPLAVKETFAQGGNLLWFVKEQVVLFLCSVTYKRDHGYMPLGELSHGVLGLLEHYRDIFSTTDDLAVLRLLRALSDATTREQVRCPCGSGESLGHCHGDIFRRVRGLQSAPCFLLDYVQISSYLMAKGRALAVRDWTNSKVILRCIDGSAVPLTDRACLGRAPKVCGVPQGLGLPVMQPPFRVRI